MLILVLKKELLRQWKRATKKKLTYYKKNLMLLQMQKPNITVNMLKIVALMTYVYGMDRYQIQRYTGLCKNPMCSFSALALSTISSAAVCPCTA